MQPFALKWTYSSLPVHYRILKTANFWSPLAPLLKWTEMCFHWAFSRKFNFAQLSFEGFFDIINIFCCVKTKNNFKNYVLITSWCATPATLQIFRYTNDILIEHWWRNCWFFKMQMKLCEVLMSLSISIQWINVTKLVIFSIAVG